MPPDGEMSVSVPTIVQWDFLESELERVLSNPVALPAVGRLRLSNISVEPDGRRISIGADVATDHFRRRIWIGARPILRPSMKKIFFRELTLSLGGTSSLENNLAANGGALLGLLAPLATVDYSSEENRLIGRAQRMLDSLSSQLT